MKIFRLLNFAFTANIFFITFVAHAYIPKTPFVFDRISALHGRGTYHIDQELTFQSGSEQLVVRERWIVVDGGEMKVIAKGNGFQLTKLLKQDRNYWFEDDQNFKSSELGTDLFMKPLLTRGSTELKKIFVKWAILPGDVLREKKPLKDIKIEKEPFVRLGRVAGTVAYVYGAPTPVEGGILTPGLWVEQDSFIIRKMRSPSGAEFHFDDYGVFPRDFWFPKTQTISFENNIVTIRVLGVKGYELSAEQKKKFDPKNFKLKPDVNTVWPTSGLTPVIQEFYSRFR